MKISEDKLFDYAYGELPENEIEEVEHYLAKNPEALQKVNEYISMKQSIEDLPALEKPIESKTSWITFFKLTFGGGLAGATVGAIATLIIFGTNIIIPQATFQVADLKDKDMFLSLPSPGKNTMALKKNWSDKLWSENVSGQKNKIFQGLTHKNVWKIESYMNKIFDNNFNSKSIEIKLSDQNNKIKLAWLQPIDITKDEENELLQKEVCNDLIEHILDTTTEAICRRAALFLDDDIIFIDACKKNKNTWKICYFEDVN